MKLRLALFIPFLVSLLLIGATTWAADPATAVPTTKPRLLSPAISQMSAPVPRPDLIVSSLSFSPPRVYPGDQIVVTETTRNAGNSPTLAATDTRYFLSTDLTIGNDMPLGSRVVPAGLPAGTGDTRTSPVSIIDTTPVGSYYLVACVDTTGRVAEANEGNNCTFAAKPMVVGLPKLLVTSLSNSPHVIKSGIAFQVTDTTANSGTMPTRKQATVRYYLRGRGSTNTAGVWKLIGTRPVEVLAAGANNTATVVLTVSINERFPAGPYRLEACIDGGQDGSHCMISGTPVLLER